MTRPSRPRPPRKPASRKAAARRPGGRRRTQEEKPLPEYLSRLGLSPRKALGQHFLIDEFVLGDIADACELDRDSLVLEIGAGPGGLTAELARRAGRVVAVELDEELAALTRARLADERGVCVLGADVLAFEPWELLDECGVPASERPDYTAVGNLPYYITQPVVRRLLESDPAPRRIIVMVQREVARRIVGGPGQESLLSISVKCYGAPSPLFDVPSDAFWPEPKVQSSVIRIDRRPSLVGNLDEAARARFFRLVRAGFSEPRKQLHNTLRNALGLSRDDALTLLEGAGIDPVLRPQHLALEDWQRLYEVVLRSGAEILDVG